MEKASSLRYVALLGFLLLVGSTFASSWQVCEISTHEVTYKAAPKEGYALQANQRVVFSVPQSFSERTLAFARLRFRKDLDDAPQEAGAWDDNGSYVRFLIQNGDEWRYWADQFGKEKRAAPRPVSKAKKSTFYNVNIFGAKKVALENRGEGDPKKSLCYVHSLTLTFLGENKLGHFQRAERHFRNPQTINAQTIRFNVNEKEGEPLCKGQQWDFHIPQAFQQQHLLYAVLSHRKKPGNAVDIVDGIDPHPAYLQFRALDRNSGKWHWWVDRYSRAKYSEVREKENPEDEILHNCLKCLGPIEPSRVSLTNEGYGNANYSIAHVHSLDLAFRPSFAGANLKALILTPQTAFTDLNKGAIVPLFGGGPRLDGRFPNALALGVRRRQRQRAIAGLPKKHRFALAQTPLPQAQGRVDGLGRLHIPLPVGQEFIFFEVIIGDLDVTSLAKNKDGYFGRSGRAELSIHYGKERQALVTGQNVGMACLITAAPKKSPTIIKEGDELLLTVHRDVAFLMGYRLVTR